MAQSLWTLVSGSLVTGGYFGFRWFLQATDVVVRYRWDFNGTPLHPREFRPNLDIRNHSKSHTYLLASIEYRLNGVAAPPLDIDNRSLWGKELKPGTIQHFADVAPVKRIISFNQAFNVEVLVRTQSGKDFWLKGQGPKQSYQRIQRVAYRLRDVLDKSAIPLG
jgi:hypothetical protein